MGPEIAQKETVATGIKRTARYWGGRLQDSGTINNNGIGRYINTFTPEEEGNNIQQHRTRITSNSHTRGGRSRGFATRSVGAHTD